MPGFICRMRSLVPGMVVMLLGSLSLPAALADDHFSPYVDDAGNISLPTDFRASLVHLGSWFVPEGDASGFHDVYTERATVMAFRETGKFPVSMIAIRLIDFILVSLAS